MPLSKKTVAGLEAIARKLERMRHKEHFNMNAFVQKSECGTAHCIAGIVLIQNGYRPVEDLDSDEWCSSKGRKVSPEFTAKTLLGLTYKQKEQLFYATGWPLQFRQRYGRPFCATVYNNPKVAAARIRHFIETGGKE